MNERASQNAPTVTGVAAKCAIAALEKHNVAAQPLMVRAGLSGPALVDPQRRVPAVAQAKFLEYAAEAMADTAFGLHLAEQSNPRQAGLLFYVVSAAKTLGEGLRFLVRYSRIVNESVHLELAQPPEGVTLEFKHVGISQRIARQNREFATAMVVKAIREFTGRDIRPTRATFAHSRANDLWDFERFYGCSVEFGASSDRLEFSSETVALPLLTGDPYLFEVLRPFSDEAARARNTAPGSIRATVENEIQRLLPHGRARAQTVAKALALSVRTLSRRLAAEGATFAEVIDQLRRSLALEYLAETNFTSAQIAWLLGYEDPTSFNHAFKRWTGHSPSAARSDKQPSKPE